MEDLSKFRQARSTARRAIRKAKNDWFQEKANEIEREKFGGKKVWKAIREMCNALVLCSYHVFILVSFMYILYFMYVVY